MDTFHRRHLIVPHANGLDPFVYAGCESSAERRLEIRMLIEPPGSGDDHKRRNSVVQGSVTGMIQVTFHSENVSVTSSEIVMFEDDNLASKKRAPITGNAIRFRPGIMLPFASSKRCSHFVPADQRPIPVTFSDFLGLPDQ
jgi:hypothetical protein